MYHLTDSVNWHTIQRYGLLSTRNLLLQSGMSVADCERIVRQQRTQQLVLPNGTLISDQRPMARDALARCLVGIEPEQWYALLNSKVFFWFDTERLNRMRRVMFEVSKVVLVIDTEKLLARYAGEITLTPINTGNTRRAAAKRGAATFVPYAYWLRSGWLSEAEQLGTKPRADSHQPVELTIDDAVPDVLDFVLDVRRLEGGELLQEWKGQGSA